MMQLLILFLVCIPFLFPQVASAHAFGQLYNLPVPFWLYLYGGVAAIVISFVIIGYFFTNPKKTITYPVKKLPLFLDFLLTPIFINVSKIISIFLFLFTILTGLVGSDYPTANFNMNFFWIFFVLGFTYIVAIWGDIWNIVNPWKILAEYILGKTYIGLFTYPKKLSYYPAFILYIIFIWLELFGSVTPYSLSLILLLYTMINILGITTWGEKAWFTYGEFFSVFYALLGKMGIIEKRKEGLFIRPPFVRLLEKPNHISALLFILFMLASTAYDGFHSTTIWVFFISDLPLFFGNDSYKTYQIVGLLLSPFVFLIIYSSLVFTTKIITGTKRSLYELCLDFAYSFIPIAFVYNVAHYFTLLITEGQNMMRLLSDPFGLDWNLFGTAGNFDIYIPDANVIWHAQVAIILFGHIIGVYIAHIIALRVFPDHKKALLSQLPMLLLMVLYTMAGLWILSQPITSGN